MNESEIKIIGDCPDEITGWVRHVTLQYKGYGVSFKMYWSEDYGYDHGVPTFNASIPDELRLEFTLNYLGSQDGLGKLDDLTFDRAPLNHREARAKALAWDMIELYEGDFINIYTWPKAMEVIKDYFQEHEIPKEKLF